MEAVERAGRLGYDRMALDTLPEMAGVLDLYRSLGFVENDRYWDNPIGRLIYLAKALPSTDEGATHLHPEAAP